jgi:hypothetical protein
VKKKAQEEAREMEYFRHKFSKVLPIEAFNSQYAMAPTFENFFSFPYLEEI